MSEWKTVFGYGGIHPDFDYSREYEFRRSQYGKPFRNCAANFSPYYNMAGGLQFREIDDAA